MICVLALLALSAPPLDALRVQARPELPWVVAVAALNEVSSHTGLQEALTSAAGALDEARASARVERVGSGTLVVIEGPPEGHDAIVAAARGAASGAAARAFVLFVDGRTPLKNQGRLPAAAAHVTMTTTIRSLALAPGPGLLDVEGEALVALVAAGLQAPVSITIGGGRCALVVEGTLDDVTTRRAALVSLTAAPLPVRLVEQLRTGARARIAERRAHAGGWARDMAAMWLAFGTLDVEEPTDLGSALRARIFAELLAP